jgi:hypothetical protein
MRRLRTALVVLLALGSTWMTYDNVLSDVGPTQGLAAAAACRVSPCKTVPVPTSTERTPLGQTFEFTLPARTVHIRCSRAYVLAGPMLCDPSS